MANKELEHYEVDDSIINFPKKAGKGSGKIPSFLGRKIIICPICGREEKANAEQENVIACSRCTFLGLIKIPKEETNLENENLGKSKSSQKIKYCVICGERFKTNSNSQKFCNKCRIQEERERKRIWKRNSIKERNAKSLNLYL